MFDPTKPFTVEESPEGPGAFPDVTDTVAILPPVDEPPPVYVPPPQVVAPVAPEGLPNPQDEAVAQLPTDGGASTEPPTPPAVDLNGNPQQVWRSFNGVPEAVDPGTVNWTGTPVVATVDVPRAQEVRFDPAQPFEVEDAGFDPAQPFEVEGGVEGDGELPFWEKVQKRWAIGREQAVDDQKAYRAMTGEIPWEQVRTELDPSLSRDDAKGKAWYSEGLLAAVEMVPAMAGGVANGIKNGLAFAMAGGTAAAVAGQAGPQVAAPEEVLTVPAAAAAGYSVGQTFGSMNYWYQQGAGSMYHELRKEGVPHKVAQTVSAGFGIPYAAIELAQVQKLVPGLKQTAAQAVAKSVKRRLAELAARKGVDYVEQIGQETGQELLAIGGEALAEWTSGVEAPADKASAWDRVKNTIVQTAQSVPFLMVPGTAVDVGRTVAQPQVAGTQAPAADTEVRPPGESRPANLTQVRVPVATVTAEEEAAFAEAEADAASKREGGSVKGEADGAAAVPPRESQGKNVASVPTMMTRKMEADLRAMGKTQEEINAMTPAAAWEILNGRATEAADTAVRPPGEAQAEVVRGWVANVLRNWRTALRVVVHDSAGAIPDGDLRRSVEEAGKVEAFFDPATGTINLLADRVRSQADVERLIRHEGMHWAFSGPLAKEYEMLLETVARTIPAEKAVEIARRYSGQSPAVWLEEYLAYEGQRNPESPTWRRFVYEVKVLLAKVFGDKVQFTDADVRAFLSKANRVVDRSGPKPTVRETSGVRFAKDSGLPDGAEVGRGAGMPDADQAGQTAQPASNETSQGADEAYRISHRPMGDEGGASRLHDLTSAAFDENIYGPKALQYYGSGDARERKVVALLKSLRGNPDAKVTIFRGIPDGVTPEIKPGDWVTLSREVAEDYGTVVSKTVKASDVTAWADALLENGYFPQSPDSRAPSSGAQGSELRFSKVDVAAQDAQYLELAKDPEGNRAELQRMVDRAAKDAGYNVGPVWHAGTVETQFAKDKIGSGKGDVYMGRGFYFHEDRDVVEALYGQFGKVRPYFIRARNPVDVVHSGQNGSYEKLEGKGIDSARRIVRDAGNVIPMGEWVVWNPSQIKSADPVTYDPEGNVIPLSQRFNEKSPDIRFSKVTEEAAASPEKKRRFIESAQRAAGVLPSVKERIAGVYAPVSNAETVEAARQRINARGVDGVLAELMGTSKPEAVDYAAGIDLIARLQGAGRLEDAARLIERMAETATDQGRAIQALSLLSKLTPEGIQVYAARVVAKAVERSPVLAKQAGELTRLRRELAAARKALATQAILRATRRGSKEGVQARLERLLVANKGSLWGRYRDQAVRGLAGKLLGPMEGGGQQARPAALQEFTRRLARQLREKVSGGPRAAGQGPRGPELSEAEAIGEAIRNFEKYEEVWTAAQAEVRAALKDNPEALQSLDGYLGEILREPFSEKSVDRAVTQTLKALNTSMREVMVQSQADQRTLRARLVDMITAQAGVSPEEATGLAEGIVKAFDAQQRAARDATLRQMEALAGRDRVAKSKLRKLIEANNSGQLDDMRFFAHLARQYGIPAWTPELSARVQAAQRAYERAQDPELKLAKAAEMFDVVHEVIPADAFVVARGLVNIGMLLNPLTWTKNVLGNSLMWALNVPADAVALAVDRAVSVTTGERTRTSMNVAQRVAGLGAAWTDFRKGYDFARDEGKPFRPAVAEGVQTMLTLARMASRGKWDVSQVNTATRRVFSKGFMRALEDTLAVGLSVSDRMFHQAAVRESLARQMQMAEARGEKLVAPTMEMMEEAFADGARAVFQSDSALAKGLSLMARGMNWISTFGKSESFGLGTAVLPFVQVPAGILVEGVRWSPLGFIKPLLESRKLITSRNTFDQKAFAEDFSRALLGTAVPAALGFYLFTMGILTGVGEDDDDLEALRESSGLGKYRVNVSALKRMLLSANFWMPQRPQDGDVTVNFDWLQPIALSVAFGASVAQQQEAKRRTVAQGKPEKRVLPDWAPEVLEVTTKAGFAGVGALENLSVLSGLSRFAGNVARKSSIMEGAAQSMMDLPSMFVPTLISRINMLLDNTVRETRAGSPVDQAVARIEARIPGLSRKFPPKYDVFGEAVERYGYGGNSFFNVMLNPTLAKKVKMTPEVAELYRVMQVTGDLRMAPRRVPVKMTVGGMQVELTNEQISQYQRVAGQMTMAMYARLAASPQFAQIPAGTKAEYMVRVLEEVNLLAKATVLQGNPTMIQDLQTQAAQRAQAQQMLMQVR